MGWSEIIAAIMKVVGPLLSELLRKWLDNLLKKAAKVSGAPGGDMKEDALLLLTDALHATKPRMFMKRALLRKLIEVVPETFDGVKITKADRNEISAYAGPADSEK